MKPRPEPSSTSPVVDSSPQESTQADWIVLAHILRPQGRKGEVLAEMLTDFPERFETNKRVFLAPEGFAGEAENARTCDVASFWLPVGRNEGRIVLHFGGIDSINQAELLGGLDVLVPHSERVQLEDDDASYISDLIGCTLFDVAGSEGMSVVGIVTDVQFATTPDGGRRLDEAAPLIAVETPDGSEVLVPFVKAFLISVDPAARRIEMSLPLGLVDLNR